jgi:hypothetical protein
MLECIDPVFLDIYFKLYNILLKVDRYILLFLRRMVKELICDLY